MDSIYMEDIEILGTTKTPHIHFVYEKGELLISGISIPENTVDFYHKLMYWITEYSRSPKPKTKIIFKFEYFNTSTSVVLLNIIKMISDSGTDLSIDWYYEYDDTEMLDVGKDYKKITDVEFNLISIESF